MQTQIKNCLTCSVLTIAVVVAGVLGAILFTNFDGWGTLLSGLLLSAAIQLLLGMLITGLGLLLLRAFPERFDRRRVTLLTLTALFAAGLLLALPLVSILQQRRLDLLDAVQTLLLIMLFVGAGLALRFVTTQAGRVTGDEPKPYDLPPRLRPLEQTAVSVDTAAMGAITMTAPIAPEPVKPVKKDSWKTLYGKLLGMVGGDESVARSLIEFERDKAPDATPETWIDEAIRRLLRDRH